MRVDGLLGAMAAMIWGSTYIVTTEWLPSEKSITTAALRVLPAGILLVVFCTKRLPADTWWRVVILGVLNIAIFQAMLFVASHRLPGGIAALGSAVQPMAVLLLTWAVDRVSPNRWAIGACVMAGLGLAAVVAAPVPYDLVGLSAVVIGSASMAAGTFLARRWSVQISVFALTGFQMLVGGVVLLLVALWLEGIPAAPTATQWAALSYLSLVGGLLAYVMWFRAVARLAPLAVTSLVLLSPVTAALLGWALRGESLSGLSIAGIATVLASVFVLQWITSRGTRRSPSELT